MHYEYDTKGVCARHLSFDLEDNKIRNLEFVGGCNGNLKAIAKLAEGTDADFLVSRLQGNTCGFKGTSCADQFAKAILEAKKA